VSTVVPIDTPGLGDRTYLAHDGRVALVVDPQRDYDRVLDVAAREGVTITHVFETHIHNDYVTGGLALAREVGAAYLVNADDEVDFERTPVRDGEVVEVGDLRVRALHTPGHTHTHLSFALEAVTDAGTDPIGVFTGGSLLFGATGRPDLLGPDHTDGLVRDQWRSAQRLAGELPDAAQVFPTHGFGSFCSATQSEATASTIGDEKRLNPVLTQDEEAYVAGLLAGLDDYPVYYAQMAPQNAAGPQAPDLTAPGVADPAELRRRIETGEWIVDLRSGSAFAAGHLVGSVNFGIDGQFITYLAWVLPYDAPLTLLGETPEQVAQAQRELVRVGWSKPAAMATGKPEDWAGDDALASFPVTDFAGLAEELQARPDGSAAGRVVLDVRRASEYDSGHIDGAVNVPIHTVLAHLDSIPRQQLWIHCGGGYRASVVAGLLDARGFDVVAIDDGFDNAGPAGLPIV
jgi:glyoxylase-like metal-dependent hydrolase (beta-lactamase superfamily II)/rhodanese-related sulfurtransferase